MWGSLFCAYFGGCSREGLPLYFLDSFSMIRIVQALYALAILYPSEWTPLAYCRGWLKPLTIRATLALGSVASVSKVTAAFDDIGLLWVGLTQINTHSGNLFIFAWFCLVCI